MGTSHEVQTGLTLERVVALEQQVRELRRVAPVLGAWGTLRPPRAAPAPSRPPVPDQGLGHSTEQGEPLPPAVPERRRQDRRRPSPLDALSPRERDVLDLMAQGCSNTGVALRLHLSERTVEATSAHLFRKLGLEQSRLTNRRVQAVLVLLRCRAGADPRPGTDEPT